MNHEEFDAALLGVYRAAANERPAPGVDAHLLHMARAQASRRRRLHYAVPLVAAALLVLAATAGLHLHSISASKTPNAQATLANELVTRELLRLQPPRATPSTVTDFLRSSDSRFVADAKVNRVP